MITDLESILYQAEEQYLQTQELAVFKSQIFSLEKRLKIYELLSSSEVDLFQYIANKLIIDFPDIEPSKIEKSLQHWLLVMRHCAMAMLSDNQQYLPSRILEWLPEQIEVSDLGLIEEKLFFYLNKRLKKTLNNEDFSLLEPFLYQAQNALLTSS